MSVGMSRFDILEGLRDRFQNSRLADVVSGMWLGRAPDDTQPPYIVMSNVSGGPPREGMNGRKLQTLAVEITIYSVERGLEEILHLFDLQCDVFDDYQYEVKDGAVIMVQRGGDMLEELGEDEGNGWLCRVEYTVLADNLVRTQAD